MNPHSNPSGATGPPVSRRRLTAGVLHGGSKASQPGEDRPTPAAPAAEHLWVAFALLLALDWILVLAYQPSAPPRVTVPYSYFTQQIQQGNVASVTAQGPAICRGRSAMPSGLLFQIQRTEQPRARRQNGPP